MERGGGGSRWRQNAMRSALVVLGAAAFGYLSIQVGFKPFLDRARESINRADPDAAADSGAAVASEDTIQEDLPLASPMSITED